MEMKEVKHEVCSLTSNYGGDKQFYNSFRKIHLSLELFMTFITTLMSVILFLIGHNDQNIIQARAEIYFNHFVLIPVISNISLYIVTYILVNDNYISNSIPDNAKDIIINISFVLFVFSATVFYQFFPMVYASFIIPIIIAAVYGKYRLVIMNSVLTVVLGSLSVFVIPYDTERVLTSYYLVNIVVSALLTLSCIIFSLLSVKYVKSRLLALQKSADTIAKLRAKLNTDNVTGVYSILELNKYCRNLRKTESGSVFSVAYLAIDEFMNINKNFGYAYGDKVLGTLGELMLGIPSIIPMRYGGAEFVLIIKRDSKEAISIIDELRRAFAQKCKETLNNPYISFSAGVTQGDVYRQPEIMMAQANSAMNYARVKENSTFMFDPNNMQLDEKRFID